jgi:PAS domain S-box-containing protein
MSTNDPDDAKPANSLKLSKEEIRIRKRWLKLEQTDEDLIRKEIASLIEGHLDELMDNVKSHFGSLEETRSLFAEDDTLERLQSLQKQYFASLAKGSYGLEYVENRLALGSADDRIDLEPQWYIGAYSQVLSWLLPQILTRFENDKDGAEKSISAFMKLVFFDMGLAIESYILAEEEANRKHRAVIKELEMERVVKSILEDAPIGIVSLSHALNCMECNDEFLAVFGVATREEVLGKALFEIAPGLKGSAFEDVISSGQSHRRTGERLHLANRVDDVYLDWAIWPVKDDKGKVGALVAMFTDATNRVLLQQQREDFVATLTHDLKTPISAANRAVTFILEGDFGDINTEQREVLETILQSNTKLYALVQTLLDVYRFDSGVKVLYLRQCRIDSIIIEIVTEIMPLAHEKAVSLEVDLPVGIGDVYCDEDEIRRVIQNLIDNSLKFTASGGRITVAAQQDAGKTIISISDTGRGIPEENKPKLFQRFWQAGSTGRHYASTGLGLYLCRRIIDGHNGRIWCESEVDKGSTFSFEINNKQLAQ